MLASRYRDMSQIAARTGLAEDVIQGHWDASVMFLEEAYKMEGFAHHYLSDQFAAGHLRTPRSEAHFAVKTLNPDPFGLKGVVCGVVCCVALFC